MNNWVTQIWARNLGRFTMGLEDEAHVQLAPAQPPAVKD